MIKKANIPAIIMLVLVASSMSNAALSLVVGDGTTFTDPGDEFTISIGDTIWIGINDSIGEMYMAFISKTLNPEEEGEWTGNSAVYSPPAISTAPGWTYFADSEQWLVDLQDPYSTEIPLPGVGCAVEFRGLSERHVWVELNPSPVGYPEDALLLNIVPEPTTVLLLALGSVALTRRRR